MTCEDRAVRLRASYDKWQEEKERHYMLCGQQELEQKKYERLKKTKEMLNEAKEAMTARYAEPVKKSFLRHYSEMAANSVPQFHLDANAAVTVDECGMQRKAALLSQGSRDLIGISLRVALIDAMYTGEKPMILMDDPFACLDDGKLEGALEWLGTLSKEYQIIYFTCSRYRCI
jgi:DNA repair exonuclease SbcCD ATPase subunit